MLPLTGPLDFACEFPVLELEEVFVLFCEFVDSLLEFTWSLLCVLTCLLR